MDNAGTYNNFDEVNLRNKEGALITEAPSKMGLVSGLNPCIWFYYHL